MSGEVTEYAHHEGQFFLFYSAAGFNVIGDMNARRTTPGPAYVADFQPYSKLPITKHANKSSVTKLEYTKVSSTRSRFELCRTQGRTPTRRMSPEQTPPKFSIYLKALVVNEKVLTPIVCRRLACARNTVRLGGSFKLRFHFWLGQRGPRTSRCLFPEPRCPNWLSTLHWLSETVCQRHQRFP